MPKHAPYAATEKPTPEEIGRRMLVFDSEGTELRGRPGGAIAFANPETREVMVQDVCTAVRVFPGNYHVEYDMAGGRLKVSDEAADDGSRFVSMAPADDNEAVVTPIIRYWLYALPGEELAGSVWELLEPSASHYATTRNIERLHELIQTAAAVYLGGRKPGKTKGPGYTSKSPWRNNTMVVNA